VEVVCGKPVTLPVLKLKLFLNLVEEILISFLNQAHHEYY
jgi:hypothetical protein